MTVGLEPLKKQFRSTYIFTLGGGFADIICKLHLVRHDGTVRGRAKVAVGDFGAGKDVQMESWVVSIETTGPANNHKTYFRINGKADGCLVNSPIIGFGPRINHGRPGASWLGMGLLPGWGFILTPEDGLRLSGGVLEDGAKAAIDEGAPRQ